MSIENKALSVFRKKNSVLFLVNEKTDSFIIDQDTIRVQRSSYLLEIHSKHGDEIMIFFDNEKEDQSEEAFNIVLEEWKLFDTQDYNSNVQNS